MKYVAKNEQFSASIIKPDGTRIDGIPTMTRAEDIADELNMLLERAIKAENQANDL